MATDKEVELKVLSEEIAEWISSNLEGTSITDLLEDISDGVVLCQMVVRCGTSCRFHANARTRGPFFIRDNLSMFLKRAKEMFDVPECMLFDPDDLLLRRNVRQVLVCVLSCARASRKYGLKVPRIVELEEEIDELEKAETMVAQPEGPPPPLSPAPVLPTIHVEEPVHVKKPEASLKKPEIDEPCKLTIIEKPETPPPPPIAVELPKDYHDGITEKVDAFLQQREDLTDVTFERVGKGKYVFYTNQGRTGVAYVRELRNALMVRVGGGWLLLSEFIRLKYGQSNNRNLNAVYKTSLQDALSKKPALSTRLRWDPEVGMHEVPSQSLKELSSQEISRPLTLGDATRLTPTRRSSLSSAGSPTCLGSIGAGKQASVSVPRDGDCVRSGGSRTPISRKSSFHSGENPTRSPRAASFSNHTGGLHEFSRKFSEDSGHSAAAKAVSASSSSSSSSTSSGDRPSKPVTHAHPPARMTTSLAKPSSINRR